MVDGTDDLDDESIFAGSDGGYYTDWQVNERLRNGAWRLCMRDEAGRQLLGTDDELLFLVPVDRADLPTWCEIRVVDGRPSVVDTRRTIP